MSKRAKVICHMMTTIDGKIVIDFDGNEDYEKAGEEYDRRSPSTAPRGAAGGLPPNWTSRWTSPGIEACRYGMRTKSFNRRRGLTSAWPLTGTASSAGRAIIPPMPEWRI